MSERPQPQVEDSEKHKEEAERLEVEAKAASEAEIGQETGTTSTAEDVSAGTSSETEVLETGAETTGSETTTGPEDTLDQAEKAIEIAAEATPEDEQDQPQAETVEPEETVDQPEQPDQAGEISGSEPAVPEDGQDRPEPQAAAKEESAEQPEQPAEAVPEAEVGTEAPSDVVSEVSPAASEETGEIVPQAEPAVQAETAPQAAQPEPQVEEPAEAPPEEDSGEFARLLAESEVEGGSREVEVGDKVSGVVVKIEAENTFIDFGGRSEGVIRTSELQDEAGELQFVVGDPLEAFVAAAQEEVILTRRLTQEDRQADMLYQAYKAGIPVEGRVDAVNKWGLGVTIQAGVRAFCPISQVDTRFVENAEEYRGKTMIFKIIEFRNQGRNIVVSRRALLEEEQNREAEQVRVGLKKGTEVEGTVTRLESFGAFVDLGAGVEGLVHVSELSHQRVGHPQEVLSVGDQVKVAVLRTKNLGHRRKERISLSLKVLEKNPWEQIREEFPPGTVIDGKVDALEDFGAFVEVSPGVRGMIHVSEIAPRRVGHPREVLEVGQEVKVVVLEVDARRRRLRLSIKQVESLESATNLKEFQTRQKKEKEEGPAGNVMLDALKRAKLID